MKKLRIDPTNIPGLLVLDLPVYGDSRGWFKENWQRQKMVALGLPDFRPIQNNVSFNDEKGVTRGIHAEPWDKYVSVGFGKVFGVWVDLREGSNPNVYTAMVDPTKAVFVPRGVGNAYQSLEEKTVYTYLVNDHWSSNAKYLSLNLSSVAVEWPIPLDRAIVSDKDRLNPKLEDVVKMPPQKQLIIGANGQLGRALQCYFPNAECVDIETFDMTDPHAYESKNWQDFSVIINAGAYTNVDGAETPKGRQMAWATNATAVMLLSKVAIEHNLTLVHVSSDYVFDGTQTPHSENEPYSPLGVYGQSKVGGDLVTQLVLKHYLVRTSWVVGQGKNFVKTMYELCQKGVEPKVVNDQIGRLTFTRELARGIHHLITTHQEYGTYNLTNDGEPVSWYQIAKLVYEHDPKKVTGISTLDYCQGKCIASRPLQSVLDLHKIKATGFQPCDWRTMFIEYLTELQQGRLRSPSDPLPSDGGTL